MKKQKLGRKWFFDFDEPKGWFKKFIRRDTRNLIKRETNQEVKENQ